MTATPYIKPIDYGIAELHAPWPYKCGPRQLRGAVIAELAKHLSIDELTPWRGRNSDGAGLQGPPIVSYRVGRDGAALQFVGPSTARHLGQIARHLGQLALPNGERVDVRRIVTNIYHGEVRKLRGGAWVRYELETPMFPSDSMDRRRPPGQRWGDAWASFAIEAALRRWVTSWGIDEVSHRPIHVASDGLRSCRVEWGRPKQDKRVWRKGISGAFVTNVMVPTGISIGAHASEGFGVLRVSDVWEGLRGSD